MLSMNAMQLANQLREVVLNVTWTANTNIKAQIENLDYLSCLKSHD